MKPTRPIKSISLFYRDDNPDAVQWAKKIGTWLRAKHPGVRIVTEKPQAVIVLGGDGTILAAAKKYRHTNAVILGLNMGHVGFLASVRKQNQFLPSLDQFVKGNYSIAKRMMLHASVLREGKTIFEALSLNDIALQNILGIVEIRVTIEGHHVQYIRGSGVLVSTATGSTAYNLSAHGPIVMPNIKCLIITEIMDHNIPTPSIVVKHNKRVHLRITSFRKRGLLSVSKTGEAVDVVLVSDGETIFPLQKKDEIIVRRSSRLVQFAELEKNYFFRSLQEKFAFE